MLKKMIMSHKTKKVSVIWSVICMLLCCSLLIGTTYAWFTDSVVSKNNRIHSGTLEVGLEYLKLKEENGAVVNDGDWKDANGSDEILKKDTLYEPGYMDVTLFRVENKGSLALKYQLALLKEQEQKGLNVQGEWFRLSDFLKFKFVPLNDRSFITKTNVLNNDFTELNRENAVNEVSNVAPGFNIQHTVDAVLSPQNANEKQYDVIALIVYMPEDVGIKAMYDAFYTPPSVTFDFKLIATQVAEEKDDFDQYYDEKAIYQPEWSAFQYIKGSIANQLNCYDGDGNVVVSVKGTKTDIGTLIVSECNTPASFAVTSGTTYKSYHISVRNDDGDLIEDDYTVTMFVGKGLANFTLYHNDHEVTDGDSLVRNVVYHADTGYVTFQTKSFSVFTAAFSQAAVKVGTQYYSQENLAAALTEAMNTGETVLVTAKELRLSQTITVPKNKTLTIDLNGCSLVCDKSVIADGKNVLIVNGTLTIKDSSPNQSGLISSGGSFELASDESFEGTGYQFISVASNGKLVLDGTHLSVNAKLQGRNTSFSLISSSNGTLELNHAKLDTNYQMKEAVSYVSVVNGSGNWTFTDSEINAASSTPSLRAIYTNNASVTASFHHSKIRVATLDGKTANAVHTNNSTCTYTFDNGSEIRLGTPNANGIFSNSKNTVYHIDGLSIVMEDPSANSIGINYRSSASANIANLSISSKASGSNGIICAAKAELQPVETLPVFGGNIQIDVEGTAMSLGTNQSMIVLDQTVSLKGSTALANAGNLTIVGGEYTGTVNALKDTGDTGMQLMVSGGTFRAVSGDSTIETIACSGKGSKQIVNCTVSAESTSGNNSHSTQGIVLNTPNGLAKNCQVTVNAVQSCEGVYCRYKGNQATIEGCRINVTSTEINAIGLYANSGLIIVGAGNKITATAKNNAFICKSADTNTPVVDTNNQPLPNVSGNNKTVTWSN